MKTFKIQSKENQSGITKLFGQGILLILMTVFIPLFAMAQSGSIFTGEWKNRTENEFWIFDDQDVVTTTDAKGTYTIDGNSISFTLSWMENGEKMSAAYSGVMLDPTTMEITYVMDQAEPNSFVLDKIDYYPLTGGWALPSKDAKWWFDANGKIQARGASGEYVRSGNAVSIVLTDATKPKNESVAYAGYFIDGNTLKLVQMDESGKSEMLILTRLRSTSVRK